MLNWGISIHFDLDLTDGATFLTTDLGAHSLIIGTRPLTYAEKTVRDITIDVFGEEFLRKIGAWQPTSKEILDGLKSGGHHTVADEFATFQARLS